MGQERLNEVHLHLHLHLPLPFHLHSHLHSHQVILGADTGIMGAEGGGKNSLRAQEHGLHPLDIDAH